MWEWKQIAQTKMDGPLFHTDVHFSRQFTHSLANTGCLYYTTVSPATVRHHKLPTFMISPRHVSGLFQNKQQTITQVTYGLIDISGHQQRHIFAYIIPN